MSEVGIPSLPKSALCSGGCIALQRLRFSEFRYCFEVNLRLIAEIQDVLFKSACLCYFKDAGLCGMQCRRRLQSSEHHDGQTTGEEFFLLFES